MTDVEDNPRRVSGSQKRQRTELHSTRFSPAEAAEITAAANRFGQAVGTFSRAAQLSVARGDEGLKTLPIRSVRRPRVEMELLAKALGQLGRVSSNLNQIAKAANMRADELEDLQATLAEIRETSRAIKQAVRGDP